jgi:hypothetical protein
VANGSFNVVANAIAKKVNSRFLLLHNARTRAGVSWCAEVTASRARGGSVGKEANTG